MDEHRGWVIFDIDGTVADYRRRQFHIEQHVPDWESFFAASPTDPPLPDGVALAQAYAASGHLLWLTGRPERYRGVTTTWLDAQDLPTAPLYMRPDHDVRPAYEFKAERVEQLATEYDITLVVDDDDLVVATLREGGWPVRHVAWMSA